MFTCLSALQTFSYNLRATTAAYIHIWSSQDILSCLTVFWCLSDMWAPQIQVWASDIGSDSLATMKCKISHEQQRANTLRHQMKPEHQWQRHYCIRVLMSACWCAVTPHLCFQLHTYNNKTVIIFIYVCEMNFSLCDKVIPPKPNKCLSLVATHTTKS